MQTSQAENDKTRPDNKMIALRLSEDDLARVKACADIDRRAVSSFTRAILMREVECMERAQRRNRRTA